MFPNSAMLALRRPFMPGSEDLGHALAKLAHGPRSKPGILITAMGFLTLTVTSAAESMLPADRSSVMAFFAKPVLGLGTTALLLPLLRRRPHAAGTLSAVGLVMLVLAIFHPPGLAFLAYHWTAIAGALIKVPLLCALLQGNSFWAGWRVCGAFYGLFLGPLPSLGLDQEALPVLVASWAMAMAALHVAAGNWMKACEAEAGAAPDDMQTEALQPLVGSSLAGVALAWLLLSVQLGLVPLLHSLHGTDLPETAQPAGARIRGSEVCQALAGMHLWQLFSCRLLLQCSLGSLLAAAVQIARLASPSSSSLLGCGLAASAFFGEGLGLALQLLLLPVLGALGTLQALALLPLSFALWALMRLPGRSDDDEDLCDMPEEDDYSKEIVEEAPEATGS
ncbi:unnamed protein product [Effrenium voratum]|nr:unnamed protein product [Effrenium voratum]